MCAALKSILSLHFMSVGPSVCIHLFLCLSLNINLYIYIFIAKVHFHFCVYPMYNIP